MVVVAGGGGAQTVTGVGAPPLADLAGLRSVTADTERQHSLRESSTH